MIAVSAALTSRSWPETKRLSCLIASPGHLPRRMNQLRVGAMMAAVLVSATPARAQCAREWKQGGAYPGVNSTEVYASTSWDPDGSGPQPELTVFGGRFTIAGRYFVNNIAAWD